MCSKYEFAMAGNRTRVDCLEGNHANLYTTIACFIWKSARFYRYVTHKSLSSVLFADIAITKYIF